MLGDSRQSLIKQELQTIVVGANEEPQVRALVPHRLHQADELALVCRQLVVASTANG